MYWNQCKDNVAHDVEFQKEAEEDRKLHETNFKAWLEQWRSRYRDELAAAKAADEVWDIVCRHYRERAGYAELRVEELERKVSELTAMRDWFKSLFLHQQGPSEDNNGSQLPDDADEGDGDAEAASAFKRKRRMVIDIE